MYRLLSVALLGCLAACGEPPTSDRSNSSSPPVQNEYQGDRVGYFGYGSRATQDQIAAWDIDIRPDGTGLPEGRGSVEDGEMLYEDQCAECHGSFGEGVGRYPVLAGGEGTLMDDRPTKSVASYWPYTSTLYDYIYRAMPFAQPESLSVDDTYAITAYVLYLNDLVADDFELTNANLASIRLPNEGGFTPDPRPDVANNRCMTNCRAGEPVALHSEVALPVSVAAVASPSAAPMVPAPEHAGKVTYDQYCSICHKVGVAGAPTLGDAESWQGRLDAGLDTLVENAIKGVSSDKGVMPAKGGFTHLSDDAVRDAVAYMVEESS